MCKLFKLKNLNTLWYLKIGSPVEILLELLGLGHFISPFQSQQWAMRVHIHPSGSPADLWVEEPISIAMLACELVKQMMSYLLHRSAGPKQQGHAPLPTTQLHQPPVYLSISIGWIYLLHCCFPRLFFQFYSWPDVLANPAWPWNFLRMNSKRTKCSQLWAERVRISLASLSGSGGAGAMHVYQALSAQRFTQLLAATALLLSFCIDSTSAQLFGDTDKDLISSLSRFRGSNQTPRIYRQCLLSMPPSFNGCDS